MQTASRLMFFTLMVVGMGVSVTSVSWFSAWVGLELNLMAFLPLICVSESRILAESGLKYFLTQALASVLIVGSIMLYSIMGPLSSGITCLALLMKLGAAPLHFWFPAVMEGLLWPQVIVLATLQKVAPLSLVALTYSDELYWLTMVSVVLSSVIGGIGGLNQTFLRKLVAFSSINHMSWMLFSLAASSLIWVEYLVIYSYTTVTIGGFLHVCQIFHTNQLAMGTLSGVGVMLLSLSLLSLGGLPPLMGFMPKWLVLQVGCGYLQSSVLVLMLGMSLVTLFFYTRVSVVNLLFYSLGPSSVGVSRVSWPVSGLLAVNVVGLPMVAFMGYL